jgi:hypothetical protein
MLFSPKAGAARLLESRSLGSWRVAAAVPRLLADSAFLAVSAGVDTTICGTRWALVSSVFDDDMNTKKAMVVVRECGVLEWEVVYVYSARSLEVDAIRRTR